MLGRKILLELLPISKESNKNISFQSASGWCNHCFVVQIQWYSHSFFFLLLKLKDVWDPHFSQIIDDDADDSASFSSRFFCLLLGCGRRRICQNLERNWKLQLVSDKNKKGKLSSNISIDKDLTFSESQAAVFSWNNRSYNSFASQFLKIYQIISSFSIMRFPLKIWFIFGNFGLT